MTTSDEIDLWRQIRILHEWHHRLAVSVQALRKLADESGLLEKLTALEKSAAQESLHIHEESLRAIDAKVRHLLGSA
jgi:hypothetical protein